LPRRPDVNCRTVVIFAVITDRSIRTLLNIGVLVNDFVIIIKLK